MKAGIQNYSHIWTLICTNRSTSTLTLSWYFSLQEGLECFAGGGERTRQRQHRRDRSTGSCQWLDLFSKFIVGSAATSELTTVGGPFSQWERHLTAILANFNVFYVIITLIKSTIDVDRLNNNKINSHHRLSIQTPDQEEQQSLRKVLRHRDSGGTHLPKNL